MTNTKNQTRYFLENDGMRIVEMIGNDTRFGKRIVVDFQRIGKVNKFNPELIAKKLQYLNNRHQLFGLSMGALMWGFTIRVFISL